MKINKIRDLKNNLICMGLSQSFSPCETFPGQSEIEGCKSLKKIPKM